MKIIDFQTDPSRYRHWRIEVEGEVATSSWTSIRPAASPTDMS